MKDLRGALDTIALRHAEGVVSNDILIKACENFKAQTNFQENFEYDMYVAKSVMDYINGIEPDAEICKAVIPGQTKMVDGVMYIYSATQPGSKNQYDWHVVKKGSKNNKTVGRGGKLSDTSIQAKQQFINQLFPKDLSSLKVINKSIGGSTGAELVEDANGVQYIMKKASNTNADHVRSEYLANQIYSALGQRTPDYELYQDDNGDPILLSKFIPMTHQPSAVNYAEMAKGWIADCLLANWDVYRNDNCLIDNAGRVFRVDNGGCLDFRAQGAKKTFDDNLKRTYDDMVKYNSSVFNKLTEQDILDQIQSAREHKDDVINYLRNSNQDAIADILEKRFDNLKDIENELKRSIQAKNKTVLPRTLKSQQDMYVDLDDDFCNKLFDDLVKKSPSCPLEHTGRLGFESVSRICQERGFDARPRVVSEAEFWKHAANSDKPIMFRGLNDLNGKTAEYYCDDFRYNDDCYYGSRGIYGVGIYAHADDVNKTGKQGDSVNNHSTQSTYKKTSAYAHARDYAKSDNSILKLAWEDDAVVVELQDLIREVQKNPPIKTKTPKLIQLETEMAQISADWKKAADDLANSSNTITKNVQKRMHYDEASLADMHQTIENTDWGKRKPNGDLDFPEWDDFVVKRMTKWITDNGGTVDIQPDSATFTLPNSSSSFQLSKYSYSSASAIKRKSAFSIAYSYPVKRFEDWVRAQHETKVENAIKTELKNSGETIAKMQQTERDLHNAYRKKKDEVDIELNNCTDNKLVAEIYKQIKGRNADTASSGLEALGVYAALKGYDGIYRNNGNGRGNGFNIILNRSKIVCCK